MVPMGSSTGRHRARLGRAVAPGWLLLAVALGGCDGVDAGILQRPDVDAATGDGDGTGNGGIPGGGGVMGDGDGSTGGAPGDGDGTAGLPGTGGMTDAAVGCHVDPDGEGCDESCVELCNLRDDDCDGDVDEDADPMCAADHAAAICAAGACILTDCDADYRDCDGRPENGCEVRIDSVEHCGGCRVACSFANAIAACVEGRCEPVGCLPRYFDCDAAAGCETAGNTLSDCGGCGTACDALDNATPTCSDGACAVDTCIGNYGDCNGQGSDGCEQELTTVDACGRCGQTCDFTGSQSSCSTGVCVATGCGAGFTDCDGDATNGCESLSSDAHCGGCGQVCTADALAHVQSAQCEEGGQCNAVCEDGYDDCDGEPNGCETPLTTVGNCGACGVRCVPDHAIGRCDGGSCEIARCEDGFADCDGRVGNGCEANLADPATCGSCDNACPAMVGCADGECRGITCAEGTADCDGAGSCDYDLSSTATCGACNVACAFDDGIDGHGTLSCAETDSTPGSLAWDCAVDCEPGFADCDDNHHNGCETDLRSLDDCGACGQVCQKQHATATCENLVCEVDTCDPDWGDCDGDGRSCERQLNTASNCGACGNVCTFDNAQGSCGGEAGSRSCTVSACIPSFYADCDDNPNNGCETDTRSDPRHCNGCDGDCTALPNAGAVRCEQSACVFDSCDPGFADCSDGAGCETDLTADATCGSCDTDCRMLPNTAMARCGGGATAPRCEVQQCAPGFGDCTAAPGCETDVRSSAAHCGACAGSAGHSPCEGLPHVVTSTCAAGTCLVASCEDGYEDCNADAGDGCEWQPAIDGTCCDDSADQDGDGFDDCEDECPLDATRAFAGECGCPSSPQPADTPCNDGLCAAQTSCDGAGSCGGDPGVCDAPAAGCRFHTYAGATASGYWYCDGALSWDDALSACRGVEGGDLIAIEDAAEQAFAQGVRTAQTWTGGTDSQAEGVWRWSSTGVQFWQGGGADSGGQPVDGRYASWEQGDEPSGNGDCAYLRSASGWDDEPCTREKAYLCEIGPDLCPDHPKVAPGVCGCAEPDIDSDGDGTVDCADECPLDAGRVVAGQCGCPSAPTMQGAPCDDGLCAANDTCDGYGQCGALSQCVSLPTLSASRNHACVVSDGRVACWGSNDWGELGNGERRDMQRGPRHVQDLYDAVQVDTATGGFHSCALRAGGQVLCWGYDASGQLGDGGTDPQPTPQVVTGIQNALSVATGSDFSCALLQDGQVRCWGNGAAGRLGRGSTQSAAQPVAVLAGETGSGNLGGVVQLSAGAQHACAVLGDGRVVCWGAGGSGRLGNGGSSDATTPVFVHGVDDAGTCNAGDQRGCLAGVAQVSAGENTTLVLHGGGLVSSFGSATAGEHGQGAAPAAAYPGRVRAPGGGTLDDGVWVAMGGDHGCALRASGQAVCWGQSASGRLGDGGASSGNQSTAVVVAGAADYAELAAGAAFNCARRGNGEVRCWGAGDQGQIGDGDISSRGAPVPLGGAPAGFVEVDAGARAACGVTTGGAVYCWGQGNNGELGHGADTRDYFAPIAVADLDDAVDVAVLEDGACALRSGGGVSCWGYGAAGGIGDGQTVTRQTPVAVRSFAGGPAFGGVVELTSGEQHVCGLRDDGTVWCWGYNAYGQLGDGSVTGRAAPVPVFGIGDAIAVGAGSYHTCAIRQGGGGTVWCWGLDDLRQLGDDAFVANRALPVPVAGGQAGFAGGRQTIEGGRGNTCALKTDGSVWCWGYNAYGNVGDGSSGGYRDVPTRIDSTDSDFVRLAVHSTYSSGICALRAGGQVLCWGNNDDGELGIGSSTGTRVSPTPVRFDEAAALWGNSDALSPVVDIAVGRDHALSTHANGSAWSWGAGGLGRLGDGWVIERTLPTAVCGY